MKKKHRSLLQILALCLFPLILLSVGLLVCYPKGGFSIHKISSNLSYNEQWQGNIFSLEEEKAFVNDVFDQPFYYLRSDELCYAFISKDEKYIVKFFKMHRLLPKNWMNDFPFSLFENYRFNEVEKKQRALHTTFFGIKAAFDSLKGRLALCYMHLNKTKYLNKKVKLIDKKGIKCYVDLDSKEFIVDTKADLLYSHLLRLSECQDEEGISRSIRSLFDLIIARCQRGLLDQDTVNWNNYGFINGRAVLIECGQLVTDGAIAYPHNYQNELVKISESIDLWAQDYCPMVSLILQKELQCQLSRISSD